MTLSRLWAGMRTRDQHDAETDERIVLIINDNGSDDLLHHTFEDESKQDDLRRGKANLYEVPGDFGPDAGQINITPGNLNGSSIRVGIRGDDAWAPEDFFVFGEDNKRNPIPLALATNIKRVLSTDRNERDGDGGDGRLSIPIPAVNLGNSTTIIHRLLVLMVTSDQGTNSPVQLQIVIPSGILVDFDMPPPSPQDRQDHQDANQANFYYADVGVAAGFAKHDLNVMDSIQLSFGGTDSWLPESFFLFGLDTSMGQPTAVVPLVYIPVWGEVPLDSSTSGPNALKLQITS